MSAAETQGGLYLRRLELGPMKNFVWLVGPTARAETAVIDPAWDVPAILAAAAEDGRRITQVVLTHRHFDHCNGLPEFIERGVPIVVHEADAGHLAIDVPREALTPIADGHVVDVAGLALRCIYTPGHTPGSICVLVEEQPRALFTGDTLFVDRCGRCDLEGGDAGTLYDSLYGVLAALDDALPVCPGHDYGAVPVSTLRRERQRNPYLCCKDRESFIRLRTPALAGN